MTVRLGSPQATRSEQIRQRQIANKLFDSFETVAFVPSIRWLRAVRTALCIGACVAYVEGWRFETVPLLLAAIVVQIILFQTAMIEVLQERAD